MQHAAGQSVFCILAHVQTERVVVQNFEVFEEDPNSSRGGRSTRRADPHFIGYTFKNWEVTAAVRGATAETGADLGNHCSVPCVYTSDRRQEPLHEGHSRRAFTALAVSSATSCCCKPEAQAANDAGW